LSEAVAKPVRITFSRIVCSSPDRLNLGFLTEGKLAAIFIKPSLGVPNWPVIYFINSVASVRRHLKQFQLTHKTTWKNGFY
jgi:hypothetical protein